MSKATNISSSFLGKTQSECLLPAMLPETFKLDDRDRSDFLAFTTKFAKALQYFNLQNKVDGNWQQLLLDDPIMLLAYVMKTNHFMEFPRYLDYRDGIIATPDFNTKKLFAQQFFSIGFHIILRINRWYKLSNKSLAHHPFRDYLYRIIVEEGRQALQGYYSIYYKITECLHCFKNVSLSKLEDLDRVWLFQPFPCIDEMILLDSLEPLVEEGVIAGQALFHLQEKIIKASSDYFKKSIERSDIAPHIGLLLTFLDLFKYQQDDLNKLTKRHLDFYYNSILGFKPLAPLPDTSHIQLVKGNSAFFLPKNTAVSAGKDASGAPIIFSTQNPLTITKGIIEQYLTLNFKLSPDLKDLEGLYSGFFKNFEALSAPSWPFFGATNSVDPNYKIKEEKNSLGFAISCPELILNSGERSIVFTFSKAEKVKPIKDIKSINKKNPILKLIPPLFDFQLTTAKEWTPFEGECVAITEDSVKFKLNLLTSDPAIVPYNKKTHLSGFKTDWPICKVTLAQGIAISDFEKLIGFAFEKLSVETNVKGAESLVLQNERGKVSPKAPFYPFGNVPFPEANFYLGSQELFIKPLSTLTLNINWDHLPDDFKFYYWAYPSVYNNDSFIADLSYFSKESQQWKTLNDKDGDTQFSLFTTNNSCLPIDQKRKEGSDEKKDSVFITKPLLQERRIIFTVDAIPAQSDLPIITAFSQKLSNAFFKLTFREPSQGFGSDEYPKLLSRITLENGQAIIWNAKCCQGNSGKCKLLEALYMALSEIGKLQIQLKSEIGKIDQICMIIKLCIKEVSEILLDCNSEEEKKEEIKTKIANCKEKIELIFQNILAQVNQILKNAYHVFDSVSKEEQKIGSSQETEKKKKGKSKTGLLEEIASNLPLPPLVKEEMKIGSKIFEGLKNITASVLEKNHGTTSKPKQSFLNRLIKGKAKPSDNDSKDDPAFTKNNLDKIASLLKELKTHEKNILKNIDELETNFIQSITTEVNTNETSMSNLSESNKEIENEISSNLFELVSDLKSPNPILSTKIGKIEDWIKSKKCNYIPLKPLPNKPFIPKIKRLSLDYKSRSEWESTTESKKEPTEELPIEPATAQLDFQFYHLEPFGNKQISLESEAVKIFPEYKNMPYAFFGLKDLNPGEILTILFSITSQIKSLTALTSGGIQYEYLSEKGWQILSLDADGTYNLEQSGIIQFVIPDDITDQSSQMPLEYFWLRIAALSEEKNNQSCFNNKVKVMTNFIATHAVTVQRNMAVQTDIQPVEVGTIKSPVNTNKAIKKMLQPISSFGGRPAETKEACYQRVAYRLNNKNRAVTPGDIENLILQNFSSLYQAIAVPMRYYVPYDSNIIKIALVPFTDIKGEHPYRPLVKPALLREVLNFSTKYCPPSMNLEVVNSDFYILTVSIDVRFNNKNDGGLFSKLLNADLIDYLSPWLKGNPVSAQQSNEKNLAALRAFVLSRPYIKEVNSLSFKYKKEVNNSAGEKELSPRNFYSLLEPWDLVVPSFNHVISDLDILNLTEINDDSNRGEETLNTVTNTV